MQIQARPDHSMRIPRPDLTVSIGTPNACSNCHEDKSAQWAADAITRWVGPKQRPRHYGASLLRRAGRSARSRRGAGRHSSPTRHNPPSFAPPRWTTCAAVAPPAWTHASKPRAMPTPRCGPRRRLGWRSCPRRCVCPRWRRCSRTRCAQCASPRRAAWRRCLPDQFDAPRRAAFDAALAEYVAAQSVSLDMPGSNLNLGALYESLGRDSEAEPHYQHALKIDPDFMPARANLSRLYARTSRPTTPNRCWPDGFSASPSSANCSIRWACCWPKINGSPRPPSPLGQAAKLMPERARASTTMGLALQQTGPAPAAERALLNGTAHRPADPPFPMHWPCCTRKTVNATRPWRRRRSCKRCGPATRRPRSCCSDCVRAHLDVGRSLRRSALIQASAAAQANWQFPPTQKAAVC